MLDGSDVVYLEKLYGHNGVKLPSRVGARLSAGRRGLGKAMMAFSGDDVVQYALRQLRPRTGRTIVAPSVWVDELHKIKDLGIAFDHEEATLEGDLRCSSRTESQREGRRRRVRCRSGRSARAGT